MKEKKETNYKKSKVIMIIGIVLLVIGIIMLITNISAYNRAKRAYDAAYDVWFDNWWNNNSATLNDMPDNPSVEMTAGIAVSVFWIIISLFITFVGAGPFLTRHSMHNGLDSVTNEIIHTETQTKESVTTSEETPAPRRKRECSHCGARLNKNSYTCDYCGKEN